MTKGNRNDDITHQNLFYTMTLGVVYQNAEGKIISANPAAEAILGLTLDQMTGRTSMDPRWKAIHEDGSEFVGETHPSIVALRTGKKIKNVVMGIFNPRVESYRWININAVPEFRRGESKPYQVYSTFEDITEQKHAIEAMKESEERYRQIFSIAPAAIYEVDYRTGKIISVNDTISEYTGYTEDELLSMRPLDLLSEESQAIFLKRLDRVLRGESVPEKVQYVARKKDGTQFTASLNTRFVYEGDEIVGATVVAQDITELSEVDLALRKSEERYRFIVDNIEDVIWTMDMNFNFTYVSPSIFKQRGFTVEEVMEQSLEEILLPDSLNEVMKLLNEKLALIDMGDKEGFKSVHFETEQPCKDGSVIWTSNEARIMPNPDRKAASMLGVTRDITERKKAEERLKASEESLRNIISASPMGIHMYELREQNQLVFIGSNAASDRILGVKHDQFIGKAIEEAFPGLTDTEVPDRYRDAAKNGKSWRTEQIHYDEGQICGAFEVVAFQTEPGKMAALFNEITSRKMAEAALQESEERFRTLVEESPLGVSLIGRDGRYKYVNPRFIEIFGYNIDEIPTGREWFEKAYPDKTLRSQIMEAWIRDMTAAKVGQARPRTYTVTCKDGSRKEIHFRPVALKNRDQFVIYEDITERSKMEKQLQQAQKFEAIGSLAGGIAHDFNNLLMGVQGRASLLSIKQGIDPSTKEHIKAIEEYVLSATNLTKQLLGFAQAGKYEIKPVDINELFVSTASMFGRTRKEIRIHSKLSSESVVAEVDRGQIEQVLLNMYVNAWQAMPDGGDLYLESRIVSLDDIYCAPYQIEPGRYVKMSLTDTGIGMKEDVRHRIFDPFFTTKSKGRGTGLGLASAYGIIKSHGGMIAVYSQPGQGSTFEIYLPLSTKEATVAAAPDADLLKGSETVLLVDDEEMILEVAEAMLKSLGYKVVAATGGMQAVDLFKGMEDEIDLVILDLVMPGIKGDQVFDIIRKIQPQMPVLLSSGYAINGQATAVLEKGCNGFIQKPFNLSELSKKIREILDNRQKLS